MTEKLVKNELQLRTGPFNATAIGLEITRQPTKDECDNYFGIIGHVREATQWMTGDLLIVSKTHYGDNVYKKAEKITGIGCNQLSIQKRLSELFNEFILRNINLSWSHHLEVSSLKLTIKDEKTEKLKLSEEPDMDKMQELLKQAEKENLSTKELGETVRKYKLDQTRIIDLANSPEKYSLFYADPPWQYGDKLVEGYGTAEHHYPTMSINELCDLPINNISTDNAVLFLWVTKPLLSECWDVINAWGFKYKSLFVWDKVKHNFAHYTSNRCEFLLICVKGSYLPESKELHDDVISIERSDKHSEKPKEFRELIEKMYPNSKKIELFAREKHNEWDVWGDEI